MLSTILRSLQRLLKVLDERKIPYMMIGGYALPFYGRIRTTIDIDLAVAVRDEKELTDLCNELERKNFEVSVGSPQNPLMVIVDRKENLEIELWLIPDGIVWDDDTLRRRRKVKLDNNIVAWVVSPEDFVINKLARPDRGVTDEQDVKSVLVRQKGRLDEAYLKRRANKAGVLTLLQHIQAA